MRLLNTKDFTLKSFFDYQVPSYAILSHTWRSANEEEILFEDIQKGRESWEKKAASKKLLGFCEVAAEECYEWVWIDTCCIDKSSSAELSEAINSMYQWYKNANICYVLLEDVDLDHLSQDFRQFKTSRWFTRGWTLQELLAPEMIEFYDTSWKEIGTKSSLQTVITDTTGIRRQVLIGDEDLTKCTIAERMSWASNRNTTRDEDIAYCLLGIFEIHMPLLYGEGAKAFQRLQEEILKISDDYSLFSWAKILPQQHSIFASSPENFSITVAEPERSWSFPTSGADDGYGEAYLAEQPPKAGINWNYSRLIRRTEEDLGPTTSCVRSLRVQAKQSDLDEFPRLTPKGLRITLPLISATPNHGTLAFLGFILEPTGELVCLALDKDDDTDSKADYKRALAGLTFLSQHTVTMDYKTFYLKTGPSASDHLQAVVSVTRRIKGLENAILLYGGRKVLPLCQLRYSTRRGINNKVTYHLMLNYQSLKFHLLFGTRPRPWCYLKLNKPEAEQFWQVQDWHSEWSIQSGQTFLDKYIVGQETDRAEIEDQGIRICCAIKRRNPDWRWAHLKAHRFPTQEEQLAEEFQVLHSVHLEAIPDDGAGRFEIECQERLNGFLFVSV